MHSLRLRLLSMAMLVVIVSVGTLAVFASQATLNAFRSSITQQTRSDQSLVTNLFKDYQQTHNQQRLQMLVDKAAHTINERLVIIDGSERVLADSDHHLTGQTLHVADLFALSAAESSLSSPSLPPFFSSSSSRQYRMLSTENNSITIGQTPLSYPRPPSEQEFSGSVNRSLALAVLIAAMVALLLTIFLSGTIIKPVRALTQAALQMEQGDLKQRVQIQNRDEIGMLAHAFNTMAISVDLSEQLRRNMVSDIAHELRTPLTNIRGYLEALQDQIVVPTSEIIALLYEESLLLGRLVTDLQDLTLAEAGQLRLLRIPIALEDIIAKATSGFLIQATKKRLTLSTDLPTLLPLVEADPARVGQILRNLLHNAILHTADGGAVTVSARVLEHGVEIQVSDTGEGIPPEHRPHLFTRFYRADRSRSRATGGTGLGLAIVDQLVRAHGGQINVESQVGLGTCFIFTLPLTAPEPTHNES